MSRRSRWGTPPFPRPRILLVAGLLLGACGLGGCGNGGSAAAGGAGGSGGKTTTTASGTGAADGGADAGSCAPACAGETACCDGKCIPTGADPNNCGGCGVVCPSSASCCRGACANLSLDPKNCGACSTACPAGDTCSPDGCSDWATWPMPNPVSAALANPASYTSMSSYVIDNLTKLWWQQPIDAPNDLGKTCSGGCTQAQAVAYCANLTLATHNDWRLPTRIELASLTDYTVSNPAINATAFPGTPSTVFWASSPYVATAGSGWGVDFGDGTTNGVLVDFAMGRARCVR